jgi:Rieske Fe-S protein
MTEEPRQRRSATRRGVLLGAGLTGIGGALAGCSTAPVPFNSNLAGGIPHDEEVPTPTPGPDGKTTGIPIATTSEIPVGGGTIFPEDNLVITQPAVGEFKAFSIVCTHVGCLCDKVADGTIDCPCHGSTFSIADGSVVTGPATRPLTPAPITITNGKITLM